MDLELATVYDISEELAKRGLQFVIVIEKTKVNDGTGVLDVCVDGRKDVSEIIEFLAPHFGIQPEPADDGY